MIWVSWSAVATWLGWILIWYLSEKKLDEYHTPFDYKYLFKNILIFSIIGFIIYNFITPLFWKIESRIYEFMFLTFISIIYFWIYFIVNLADFKYFYKEIRKIKTWRKENIEYIWDTP